jgi:putative flippase GtrA
MKFIKKEFVRFILVGGANTAFGYVLYAFLVLVHVHYMMAYTITYIISIFISYYLNTRFVFNCAVNLKSALQYPLTYVVQYLSGALFLHILVGIMAVNKLIAPLFVIALTIPLTFVLARFIIKGRTKRYESS